MPFDGSTFETTRTRADILRDWCHELRHGGHGQICHDLHARGGHCALGVLEQFVEGGSAFYSKIWLDCEPLVQNVAARNDGALGSRHHTFPEIADYIERVWLHAEASA